MEICRLISKLATKFMDTIIHNTNPTPIKLWESAKNDNHKFEEEGWGAKQATRLTGKHTFSFHQPLLSRRHLLYADPKWDARVLIQVLNPKSQRQINKRIDHYWHDTIPSIISKKHLSLQISRELNLDLPPTSISVANVTLQVHSCLIPPPCRTFPLT